MSSITPIFDGHLDLALNALAYDRDQTWPLAKIREREAGLTDAADRGAASVCLDEMRRGGFRAAVATLFARSRADAVPAKNIRRIDTDSGTPAIAHAAAHAQLAYYRLLERQARVRIVQTRDQMKIGAALDPLALVILMEGADAITNPHEAAHWHAAGVRAVSLAHYGRSAYAFGNGESGPVTPAGIALLAEMRRVGLALDLSHLCDASFFTALDAFDGPVFASHSNCRTLAPVPGDRQFTDQQLKLIFERSGVVGAVLHNGMLIPDWKPGQPRDRVTLHHVAAHIDHVCQLAGDARHAAIGSDLDGGFGLESAPAGLDSIADLQKLAPELARRGYPDADIAAIFHGNWLRFWQAALPA